MVNLGHGTNQDKNIVHLVSLRAWFARHQFSSPTKVRLNLDKNFTDYYYLCTKFKDH